MVTKYKWLLSLSFLGNNANLLNPHSHRDLQNRKLPSYVVEWQPMCQHKETPTLIANLCYVIHEN